VRHSKNRTQWHRWVKLDRSMMWAACPLPLRSLRDAALRSAALRARKRHRFPPDTGNRCSVIRELLVGRADGGTVMKHARRGQNARTGLVLGKATRREAVLLNGPDLQHAYQETHCRLTQMMLRSERPGHSRQKRRRPGMSPPASWFRQRTPSVLLEANSNPPG
jgi:hypothetical protein